MPGFVTQTDILEAGGITTAAAAPLIATAVSAATGPLSSLSTSALAQANLVASINEINEQIRAHTPSRYGAKGDVRWERAGSMTAGSNVLTSPDAAFVPGDVGKTVMIAGAGTGDDLTSTVSAYISPTQVQLAANATTTVSGVSMHIGTDDTAALQAWLDGSAAAGVTARLPTGRAFLCQQLPLRYNRKQGPVEMGGWIVGGNGWGGGFAICDKQFGPGGTGTTIMGYSSGVSFIGTGGGIVMSGAGGSTVSGKNRKGLGITYTDEAVVNSFIVRGKSSKDYFVFQPVNSRRSILIGGFYDNQFSSRQGADGVHFYGACSDWLVVGVHTYAADDGSSNTSETADVANSILERISYVNCSFRNIGHAGLKAYLNNLVGAAQIRDIEYHNCNFITEADPTTGAGAPISIFLDTGAYANGARISGIRVYGGMSVTLNPLPTAYGQPVIVVTDVAGFELHGHTIKSPGHNAIFLTRCDDAVINDCTIEHTRGPQMQATGLVVNSIAYQTGTTVRYTFSTDISALGIVGTGNQQQLIVTGANTDDNNGGFSIVGVGANYVDVRNYKRSSATGDETGITGAASVARTGAASIILMNCNDTRILDTKVKGAPGPASLLITGTTNDASNFSDNTVVRGLHVTGMYFGSAIQDYNSKNTEITGTRLRRSRIDAMINEAGSAGAVHGGARYIDNIDVDALAARALLKSNTVFGKATVNRGNLGRLSDTLRGTATQASGATTFTISAGTSTDQASLINELHLRLPPLAQFTSAYNNGNRVFTITTPTAAAATTLWPYIIEQPNS